MGWNPCPNQRATPLVDTSLGLNMPSPSWSSFWHALISEGVGAALASNGVVGVGGLCSVSVGEPTGYTERLEGASSANGAPQAMRPRCSQNLRKVPVGNSAYGASYCGGRDRAAGRGGYTPLWKSGLTRPETRRSAEARGSDCRGRGLDFYTSASRVTSDGHARCGNPRSLTGRKRNRVSRGPGKDGFPIQPAARTAAVDGFIGIRRSR